MGKLHPLAERVQSALRALGFSSAVRELPQRTRTAPEAARAAGLSVGQMILAASDRDRRHNPLGRVERGTATGSPGGGALRTRLANRRHGFRVRLRVALPAGSHRPERCTAAGERGPAPAAGRNSTPDGVGDPPFM